MYRMEDGYKMKLLQDYKSLLSSLGKGETLCKEDCFEMQNLLETEIDHVVDRMIFENTYEIFPN